MKAAILALTVSHALLLGACATAPALPNDDAATYQTLTGSGGQEFLQRISSHRWEDKGKQAAERLSWIPADARSTDVEKAKRAGEAAHTVAEFLADNKDELSRLSAGLFGFQHKPLGEENPELLRGYGSTLIPFQGALIGDLTGVPGFTLIGDAGAGELSKARRIFAVVDTDGKAGDTFTDAAYQRVRDYLRTYAQAVANSSADGLVALRRAAELAGVAEGGQRESGNAGIKTETAQHWINWAGYEVAAATGARPDGSGIPDQYFTSDGRIKSPDQVSDGDLDNYATALENFTFHHGVQSLGNDFQTFCNAGAGK